MATVTDNSKRSTVRQQFVIVDALIVLYIVLDVIAQSLPPHYSPISQAESLLAVGPYGYIMTINFLNRGVFSLLFVYAMIQTFSMIGVNWRNYRLGLCAIVIWGVGALLLAGFPATGRTIGIHTIIAIVVLIAAPLGELSISLKLSQTKVLAGAKKIALVIAGLAVLSMLFYWGVLPFLHTLKSDYSGLFERVLIGSVIAWMGIMSTYVLRCGNSPLKPEQKGAAAS